ncbi:hypothetical protein [Ancrocorticia sp.]|uniref:hypothetical protein n=1 Tax=Ancrocorticia sp. TaxID=2593684 RepID=UPI003F9299D5
MVELLWATRGYTWGSRFLLNGGYSHPLSVYEEAFNGVEEEPSVYQHGSNGQALRFPDPLGRQDKAGRIIYHDFVIPDSIAQGISSAEVAVDRIWPLVADIYGAVWDGDAPSPDFVESKLNKERS